MYPGARKRERSDDIDQHKRRHKRSYVSPLNRCNSRDYGADNRHYVKS
jgi:hypothetical protein